MAPSEAEVQAQWKAAVDILEESRNFFDGTLAAAGGQYDVLLQALEGVYTPQELSAAVARQRATASSMVSGAAALEFLTPIIFEYGKILSDDSALGYGAGFRDLGELWGALYDWFVDNSLTVQSRNITFDSSATAGGSNVGNGAFSRLTVDANGFDLEACTPEKKIFKCIADQNSGTDENAESFEFIGEQASLDALLRLTYGSGESARTFIRSHHAGSGAGGSLLTNSSFSTYDSSLGAAKFEGWTATFGGAATEADVTQDTTNFYRTHPNAGTDASLAIAMNSASDTVTLKQTLAQMRPNRLDPFTPYFFRVMWNRSISSAAAGTLTIRMGSQSANVALSAQSGWQELLIAPGTASWFENFNEDPFDIEVEWAGGTSGTLLIDDVLFAPFDLIDGTGWFLRGNAASHTPWLRGDTLAYTDTQPGPQTEGSLQYWNYVAGLGYLPSTTGSPTLADP